MLAWLRRLFAPRTRRLKGAAFRAVNGHRNEADRASEPVSVDLDAPAPIAPNGAPSPTAGKPRASARPIVNLDGPRAATTAFERREIELLERVARRIEAGQVELPHLPSTSVAIIDLASRPSVEVKDLVVLIENDPVLTSELLKIANSAFYAGRMPCETLQQAIVRIGIRALRSMIFSISVRGAVLRDKNLSIYAEEVWRQAYSVASIARTVGSFTGIDAEHAFLLGLLHDIGKVPLLSVLRQEVKKESEIGPALIGRVFLEHHEAAGAAVAKAWRLPEEIASVAGCHHDFAANEGHGRSAALASLAHKLDLFLSLDGETEYRGLVHAPEIAYLGLSESDAHALLAAAEKAFVADGAAVAA